MVTDDVADTYENASRSLFGLGYSRFINAKLYLEKDFVVHFYTIGAVGVILFLLPYILIAIYGLYKSIKIRKFNLFTLTTLAMLLLPLGVSYFSGHIIDELIITLYLGCIAGFVLSFAKSGEDENES